MSKSVKYLEYIISTSLGVLRVDEQGKNSFEEGKAARFTSTFPALIRRARKWANKKGASWTELVEV